MTLSIRAHVCLLAVSIALGIALGILVRPTPSGSDLTVTLSHPAPNIATLQVPVPVVTEKVVKEYVRVEDRTAINAVLEENRKLRVQVEQLSVTVAEYTSTNAGAATVTPLASTPTVPTSPAPVHAEFKDWRLSFTLNGADAKYTLSQKFVVLNTVGKNKNGVATQLIRLYEVGPNEQRTLIPTAETTTIVATPNLPHTFTHLTVQAGLGTSFALGNGGASAPSRAGIVAVTWLKHGRTIATEDTRWTFIAPALAVTGAEKIIGVVPIAFNLGSLPKQPFTNVWITPFFGTTSTVTPRITRFGIFGTATF